MAVTNENVKLERNRFHGAEFKQQRYVADVEQGISPTDVLNPAFWANVSAQLNPFDRIETRCEDGTWISELVVLEAGRSYARVKQLTHYSLSTAEVAQSQDAQLVGYQVFWRGHHHKWSVKRTADN